MYPLKVWQSYMRKHFTSWYHYVAHTLGITIPAKDIVLVTGWVKTDQWSMAAFRKQGRAISGQLSCGLTLAPGSISLTFQEVRGFEYAANKGPPSLVRVPSTQPSVSNLSNLYRSPKADQCIFFRYYKFKVRVGPFAFGLQAAAGPAALPDNPGNEPSPDALSTWSNSAPIETDRGSIQVSRSSRFW